MTKPGPTTKERPLEPQCVLSVDEIDLLDVAFWQHPLDAREVAFIQYRYYAIIAM